MENNFQPKPAMPTIWEANPKLKTLLLVLIFVFLASGIGLVIFAQVQAEYRQKIYEETKAGLPKHEESKSASQLASSQSEETKDWKTYRNEEYGFEFKYPSNYRESKNIQTIWGRPLESEYAILEFRYIDDKNSKELYEKGGEKITVNGHEVLQLKSGTMDGGIFYEFLVKEKESSNFLGLVFYTKKSGYESKIEEFKIILNTFKFLK